MKKLSIKKMADTVMAKRKAKKITQAQLAALTGINRGMISRLESCAYTPSIDQLQAIAEALDFEVVDLFEDDKAGKKKFLVGRKYNIAVAGTGYVGLSIATLLAQHNHVTAVDIIPEKVDLINSGKSPIQDDYIEMYLAEKELDLTATLNGEEAYRNADFVIIAAPTNYDSKKNFFDCSAVEAVIELVLKVNPDATMIIKSTIPVGYGPFFFQNHHNGLEQDFDIQPQAPFIDIFRIQFYHFFKICNFASAAHLPHTCDAGFDGKSGSVMKLIGFPLIGKRRSGTHNTHIAS